MTSHSSLASGPQDGIEEKVDIPTHPIIQIVVSGEHQHGRGVATAAQPQADLRAAAIGAAAVQSLLGEFVLQKLH